MIILLVIQLATNPINFTILLWQVLIHYFPMHDGHPELSAADAGGVGKVTSIAYAPLLMERGTVRTCSFLLPWLLVTLRGRALPPTDPDRNPVLLAVNRQRLQENSSQDKAATA